MIHTILTSTKYSVVLLFCLLFVIGCTNNQKILSGTKWRVTGFSIDSINHLSDFEMKFIVKYTDSPKPYLRFTDSILYTQVEGKIADTSNYLYKSDTLFFYNNYTRDTNIIIKLSNDSLITHSLQGIITFAVKE